MDYNEIPDDELQAQADYRPRILNLEQFVQRKYAAVLRMRPDWKEWLMHIELHNPDRPRLSMEGGDGKRQ